MRRFPFPTFVCFSLTLLVLAFSSQANAQSNDSQSRTWSDQSGRFKIEAKLVDHDDDNVRLLKSDGKVVTVPMKMLSETDKEHLDNLTVESTSPFAGSVRAENKPSSPTTPTAPATPTAETASSDPLLAKEADGKVLSEEGDIVFLNIDSDLPSLPPDPSPLNSMTLKPMAWPIGPMDAYTYFSTPCCIDPAQGRFAMSSFRSPTTSSGDHFGRLHTFGPESKRPSLALDLPFPIRILDHFIPDDRTLIKIGSDLVLLSGLSKGIPKPIRRVHLPGHDSSGYRHDVKIARMVSANEAVVKIKRNVYYWNLETGECKWKITKLPATTKISCSGGGKYLVASDVKQIQIVDIENAELMGSIEVPVNGLSPTVHFSPDGKRLAMVANNQYVIWNMSEARVEKKMQIGTSSGDFHGWVGNDYLLTSLGGLIDTKKGISIWAYYLPTLDSVTLTPKGVVTFTKDHRMSVASALAMPHPSVTAAEAANKTGGRSSVKNGQWRDY